MERNGNLGDGDQLEVQLYQQVVSARQSYSVMVSLTEFPNRPSICI
jgi:hypothetical protein